MRRVAVTGLGAVTRARSRRGGVRARAARRPLRRRPLTLFDTDRLSHAARGAGARADAAGVDRRAAAPPPRVPIGFGPAGGVRGGARTPGSTPPSSRGAAVVFGTGTGGAHLDRGVSGRSAAKCRTRRRAAACRISRASVTDLVARHLGVARPALHHHDRLLVVGDRDRLGRRSHPPRARRRGDRRRRRRAVPPHLRRLQLPARHLARARPQPFDENRKGLNLGEGGAVLVLEEYERARARGATIYAVVAGWGITADAHHMTAPHPEGDGAARAMKAALADAGLRRRADRLRERARHRHAAQRRRRDAGHQVACSARTRRQTAGLVASSRWSATRSAPPARSKPWPRCCRCARGFLPPTVNLRDARPFDLDYVPGAARERRRRGGAVELVRLRRQQHLPRVHALELQRSDGGRQDLRHVAFQTQRGTARRGRSAPRLMTT